MHFDEDGSGYITNDEFINFLDSTGQDIDHLDLFSLFKGLDTDHNGKLFLCEFLCGTLTIKDFMSV